MIAGSFRVEGGAAKPTYQSTSASPPSTAPSKRGDQVVSPRPEKPTSAPQDRSQTCPAGELFYPLASAPRRRKDQYDANRMHGDCSTTASICGVCC